MEAIKHAAPGVDRNKKDNWVPRVKNQNYNPNRNTPEYTKVIEAENLKSTIDTEAEFNRDPALVRWRFTILLSLSVMVGFGVILYQTNVYVDMVNETSNTLATGQIEQREQLLKQKTEYEGKKQRPFWNEREKGFCL